MELLGVREIAAREGAVIVEFTGECDLTRHDAVGALFARLLEENELVVVDVRRVTFLDSSFLHSLYLANQDARARGVRFCLQVGTADLPYRVLQISRLLDQVEHFETREDILPLTSDTGGELGGQGDEGGSRPVTLADGALDIAHREAVAGAIDGEDASGQLPVQTEEPAAAT